ncbi:MAG: Arc family DNA-binding protein [Candidatus Riflebacteria bacterium]|nr:Arc family DNA-binding protein [Candidatus Riflebacteria bacterium]
MPNLSLKNVSEDLYQRLQRKAVEHRRSLNSEILCTLEEALRTTRVDPDSFLARVEAIQRRIKGAPLTDELLREAKEEGRR